MRNLKITHLESVPFGGTRGLTATAWDASNDSIICAFGPTVDEPVIDLMRKPKQQASTNTLEDKLCAELVPITSWDAPCPLPNLPCEEILLMQYFPDIMTICLVLAGGDLILVREDPLDGQEKIEIVGSVDVGIAAAAWAPDQELLAIVTNSDNLILMSREFEPLTESTMAVEDLQASKHVSVGWGKKETQFKGKRAKALRDPTMPEEIDEGLPSPFDDGSASVSWRGDGAYFAVNAVVPGHRRAIRVYSREGVLDSVSEPVNGLESAISWRPSGNLIAGVRRSLLPDKPGLEIVFFERNGLRHGDFPLRLKAHELDTMGSQVGLAWNLDSTVLAVSMKGLTQYWTMGNYHYYLKQELKVTNELADTIMKPTWHLEKPLKCCVSNFRSLVSLEFLSTTSTGSTTSPHDYGIAAVVDGTVLKLTPLRHAGVPPPMAFCEGEASLAIIDVAISRDGSRLAILQTDGIELWKWHLQSSNTKSSGHPRRHTTELRKKRYIWQDLGIDQPTTTFWTQIIFKENEDVYVLAPCQGRSHAQCYQLRWPTDHTFIEGESESKLQMNKVLVPILTHGLISDVEQTVIWSQDSQHTIPIAEDTNAIDKEVQAAQFEGSQPNSAIFNVVPNSGDITNGFHSSYHKISLTPRGSLLADRRTLAKDCTSFLLTPLHLIYTTSQHLLKFIHLKRPDGMSIPGDTPEADERCRSIERGARLVTVIPSTYAVVLQMPRGNLETIYPRLLVLTGIRDSLRRAEYREAFLACQNHQVDMNLLYDYLPEEFMQNLEKFVSDLKKPSRVDEFLSKLKDEDVTQTLYKDTLNDERPTITTIGNQSKKVNKVNDICDAIISILQNKPGKFLQCIITAHVCKRPPDLTAALTLVSTLRQTSAEEADLTVTHLCFLTDANRLFDAALALYDLELTLLVAQKAQRDPREYMPFLQNLQSLPVFRRQYQIDNHLRNYSKALDSLFGLEAHDEAETYTIKHSLYTHALDLYKYLPNQLSKLTLLYAQHLASHSQSAAAATLYEALGQYAEAYPLYALAHQWRESLTCATLIPLEQSQLLELATSLATNLAEEFRDYRAAATIHLDYLSDPSNAARLLCKGSYFAEATRILSLPRHASLLSPTTTTDNNNNNNNNNLTSDISTIISTGLSAKFSEILELVSDCKSQLNAQVPRILELRVKKAEDPLAFYGGDATTTTAEGGVDIPDNVSLAPTDATTAGGQSLFTRYGGSNKTGGTKFGGTIGTGNTTTRKTSKSKRREERKRARGKKGSVYEEEYLVASVGRLLARVNGVHEEVGRLVSGLMRRGTRERAVKVGEVMREMVERCEWARREVWGADVDIDGNAGDGQVDGGKDENKREDPAETWRPSSADGVFWDSQQNTVVKEKDIPAVKVWKGLDWL